MVKEIKIGDQAVQFKSSAALPVLYRQLTGGKEFFKDIGKSGEDNSILRDMAWVMFRHANPKDPVEEMDWLARFEFMDLNNAIVEIASMLTGEQETTSEEKKGTPDRPGDEYRTVRPSLRTVRHFYKRP